MKILFINSLSADYVQDLTYSGLVKILGVRNVIDFKWNKKYHIPYKNYPKNLGYMSGTMLSSLFRSTVKEVDAVLIAASKVDAFETYLEVMNDIPAKTPIVFVDGGDQPLIGGDLTIYGQPELYITVASKRPFDLIFKREYLEESEHPTHIHPFPISFNLNRLPNLPKRKKYDVSFWAVESHLIRTQALDLLQDKFDCRKNGTERHQKFSRYKRKGSFYLQELAACKIVLNFRGGGWDTMRYWEVPAVGSFMISQRPRIRIPENFEEGKQVVYCQDDLSDLVPLCNYYLKHDAKREAIARAGMSNLMAHHTDTARAKYLLKHLQPLVKA